MNRKKTLEMMLFLRFSARKRENIVSDIESVLDLFDSHNITGGVPVHWNFPAVPFLGDGGTGSAGPVIDRIKSRVSTEKDVMIPMGYAGAYHSLLSEEELRAEVDWTYKNPSGTGFEDRFQYKPSLMMPAQMDFYRPTSRALYNNMSTTWLIAPELFSRDPKDPLVMEKLEFLDHGESEFFPLVSFLSPALPALKFFKKVIRKHISALAVLFDFTAGSLVEDVEAFFKTIEKLRQKTPIEFVQISRWLMPDRRTILTESDLHYASLERIPGTALPRVSIPHDTGDRAPRRDGGKIRSTLSKRCGNIETKEYLDDIIRSQGMCKRGETPELYKNPESYNPPPDRALIADMPGTVVIKEHTFEAEFHNGRFTNIISGSGRLLTGTEAQSYITLPEKRYSFENTGVYSFENEETRGLRELLSIETPLSISPGSMVIDYMFVGEYPVLCISVDITYPDFPEPVPVLEYAPLEIGLFQLGTEETVNCTGTYPDGTSYTVTIPNQHDQYLLFGREFTFNKEGVSFNLAFPLLDEAPIEPLPVRVNAEKGGNTSLTINPKGSYTRSSSKKISGFTEHFTLLISADSLGLEDGIDIRSSGESVPKSVLRQLQKSWLGRLR